VTDDSGRCRYHELAEELKPDVYRLIFNTGQYFTERKIPSIYPEISITFNISDGEANYHLPLLLSPNGFTTYRGS
jgi:5-hydroxyisourate hydrolase